MTKMVASCKDTLAERPQELPSGEKINENLEFPGSPPGLGKLEKQR